MNPDELSPTKTLQQVSEALPEDCRENLVVVGSLAAGFHFFGDDPDLAVRTKDVDCILEPFHMAVEAGQKIAARLLELGWQHRALADDRLPGGRDTSVECLPVIRLVPPGKNPSSPDWFIELLCVPENSGEVGRRFTRIVLGDQHFALPSFQFMAVTAWRPLMSDRFQLRYARPSMMALANLLAHPEIGSDIMSAPFDGLTIKRANKDLGRVLALAKLSDLDDYEPWAEEWLEAMKELYGEYWVERAATLGSGLRELLSSPDDLNEALHTCTSGLLSSFHDVSEASLKIVGQRLLGDAIEFIEENAKRIQG